MKQPILNDLIRLTIVISVIVGCMILVILDKNIPEFIVIGISGIISYYFGVMTKGSSSNGNDSK